MQPLILACDLGTGGNKASLYDADGSCLAEIFVPYPTDYPRPGWHEQRPVDWWDATVQSVRGLIEPPRAQIRRRSSAWGSPGTAWAWCPSTNPAICCVNPRRSGPIHGLPRRRLSFFDRFPQEDWYLLTGNGFPPALYTDL